MAYRFGYGALWRTNPVMQYVVTTMMWHGCQAAELVHISPNLKSVLISKRQAALASQFKNDALCFIVILDVCDGRGSRPRVHGQYST